MVRHREGSVKIRGEKSADAQPDRDNSKEASVQASGNRTFETELWKDRHSTNLGQIVIDELMEGFEKCTV